MIRGKEEKEREVRGMEIMEVEQNVEDREEEHKHELDMRIGIESRCDRRGRDTEGRGRRVEDKDKKEEDEEEDGF